MSSTGRVPLLDENDRFPDRFAPPSVAADAAVAEAARAGSVAAASDATAAKTGAEAARDESVAAAERAEAVPAQVDTAMADQVGTGGEFDTKLNATIVAEVNTLVPGEVSPLVPPLVADALASNPVVQQAVENAAEGLDLVVFPSTSVAATPNTVPRRDPTGSFHIPQPTAASHPVRKNSFDTAMANVHRATVVLTTEDLDTVITSGLYDQRSNASATAERHYPVASAGLLHVSTSFNNWSYQEYHTFGSGPNGNRVYRRTLYSGVWTAWQELARASDIPDIPDDTSGPSAPVGYVSHDQMQDEVQRGKGGVIGTSGRGVISIRCDHQTDEWLDIVWPICRDLNLPASFGAVTGSVGNPTATYEPTDSTWDDVRQMFKEGCEVWDHSWDHGNPAPGESYTDYFAKSRAKIEAEGLRPMGFQQPGGPSTYGVGHISPLAMQDEAGRAIISTYGLYETWLVGTRWRLLPTNGVRGYGHVTIDAYTFELIKAAIDEATARKIGVQLMIHPWRINQPGYITTATLEAALTYLAEQRDAGAVEVLTATGLGFADPYSERRFDFIPVSTFENAQTSPRPYSWDEAESGGFTIEDGLLTVPANKTLVRSSGRTLWPGLDGHVFMVEVDVRAPDVGATVHLRVTETGNGYPIFRELHIPIDAGAEFQKVRMMFGVPKGTPHMSVWVGRSGGGRVQFESVHCYST